MLLRLIVLSLVTVLAVIAPVRSVAHWEQSKSPPAESWAIEFAELYDSSTLSPETALHYVDTLHVPLSYSDSVSDSVDSYNNRQLKTKFLVDLEEYSSTGVYPSAYESLFREHYFPVSSYKALTAQTSMSMFAASVAQGNDFVLIGSPGYQETAGAVFVYTISSHSEWTFHSRIDSPTQDYSNFGCSLSIYEDQFVVGANAFDSFTGQAHWFVPTTNSSWMKNYTFTSTMSMGLGYGFSVALHESFAAVGSSFGEEVALYKLTGPNSWTLLQTISSPVYYSAMFGYSLTLNQDWLVIGANQYNNSQGAAFVYGLNDSQSLFSFHSLLLTEDDDISFFGMSLSMVDDVLAIGSPGLNGVWIDLADDSQTTSAPTLSPSPSPTLFPTVAPSQNVTLMPTSIASAAPSESPTASPSARRRLITADDITDTTGAVFMYKLASTNGSSFWNLTQRLESPSGTKSSSRFGYSVSLSANDLLIGSPGMPDGARHGAAFVYSRHNDSTAVGSSVWALNTSLPSPSASLYSQLGITVSIAPNGQHAILGSDASDDGQLIGSALVFAVHSAHGTFAPTFAPTAAPTVFVDKTPTALPTVAPTLAPTFSSQLNNNNILSAAETKNSRTTMIVILAVFGVVFIAVSAVLVSMCCCTNPAAVTGGKKKKKEEEDESKSPAIVVGPWSRNDDTVHPWQKYYPFYAQMYQHYSPEGGAFSVPPPIFQPVGDDKEKLKEKEDDLKKFERRIGQRNGSLGDEDFGSQVGAYHVSRNSFDGMRHKEKEKEKEKEIDYPADSQSQRPVDVDTDENDVKVLDNVSVAPQKRMSSESSMRSSLVSSSSDIVEDWDAMQKSSFYTTRQERERLRAQQQQAAAAPSYANVEGQDASSVAAVKTGEAAPSRWRAGLSFLSIPSVSSFGLNGSSSTNSSLHGSMLNLNHNLSAESMPASHYGTTVSEVEKAKAKCRQVKEVYSRLGSPAAAQSTGVVTLEEPIVDQKAESKTTSTAQSPIIAEARRRAREALQRAQQRGVNASPRSLAATQSVYEGSAAVPSQHHLIANTHDHIHSDGSTAVEPMTHTESPYHHSHEHVSELYGMHAMLFPMRSKYGMSLAKSTDSAHSLPTLPSLPSMSSSDSDCDSIEGGSISKFSVSSTISLADSENDDQSIESEVSEEQQQQLQQWRRQSQASEEDPSMAGVYPDHDGDYELSNPVHKPVLSAPMRSADWASPHVHYVPPPSNDSPMTAVNRHPTLTGSQLNTSAQMATISDLHDHISFAKQLAQRARARAEHRDRVLSHLSLTNSYSYDAHDLRSAPGLSLSPSHTHVSSAPSSPTSASPPAPAPVLAPSVRQPKNVRFSAVDMDVVDSDGSSSPGI